MLQGLQDRKKVAITILFYLLGYGVILAGLLLLGTISERGIENPGIYFRIFPEHYELESLLYDSNEMVTYEDGYVTGEDSWFVIEVESSEALDLELSFVENGALTGFVWCSQNDEFEMEPTVYTFYQGHNLIELEEGTAYVRFMISDQSDMHYGVEEISYRNAFELYARMHKKELVVYSFILTIFVLGIKLCSNIKSEKRRQRAVFGGYVMTVLVTALYIFRSFLAGNKIFAFVDIGSDTIQQYYPYYLNCVQRILSGEFGSWNWEYGLGTSLINNISQTLDPFGLFVILGGVIAGIDKVRWLLVVAQILKIVISAILCRYYLKLFNVSETAACIGGYLYGFNGYLMLWGQHYMLGTICIYLILMLIFIEKIIRESKVKYVAGMGIVVALSIIYSYYNTYMALLFAGIYCVIRLLSPDILYGWKERIKKALVCLGAVITGLMIGAVTLFPSAAYLVASSSRLDSNTSALGKFASGFISSYSWDETFQIIGRLMSNNLFYINRFDVPGWSNYYEMPNLCVSIFFYLFLGQLLVHSLKRCKNKKQFFYGALITIVGIIILLNPGMAIAFNGFAYVQTRFTFVIMPIAVLMIAVEWDRIVQKREFSISGLLIGLVTSSAIVLAAYRFASEEVKNYNMQVLLLIIVFALLVIGACKWEKREGVFVKGILLLFVLSTALECDITNNNRVSLYPWNEGWGYGEETVINDTTAALEYLEEIDSSFYRVDKFYVDGSVFGDPLVERYSSVTDYNSTINRNLTAFIDNLYSSVKLLEAQRIFSYNEQTEIYPMSLINVKYILSKTELQEEWCQYLNKVGDVYIYRNKEAESAASFYTKTISKTECNLLTEQQRRQLLEDTVIVDEEYDTYANEIAQAEVGQFYVSGNSISGTVVNEEDGILVLTIPDQDGWSVYVDGTEVETFNADYGFKGIELSAGEHTVVAKYQIPYLKAGAVCSAIGVVLLIGLCVFLYIAKEKHFKRLLIK